MALQTDSEFKQWGEVYTNSFCLTHDSTSCIDGFTIAVWLKLLKNCKKEQYGLLGSEKKSDSVHSTGATILCHPESLLQ